MPILTLKTLKETPCPVCGAATNLACVFKRLERPLGDIHLSRIRAAEKTHNAGRKDLQSVGKSVITKQKKTD